MIVYPAEPKKHQNALFASLGTAEGGAARLAVIGVAGGGYEEAAERARAALAVAKRRPRGPVGRAAKHALIRGQYCWARRYFTRHPNRVAVCWNGLTGSRKAFMDAAHDAGAPRLFAELAPFPGRMTLDPAGVNAAGSVPREPGFFTDWAGTDPDRTGEGWRALAAGLTARGSRRGDVAQTAGGDLAAAGPFLFVPLQVPDDSQIRLFAGWTGSVEAAIEALAAAAAHLPEGWHLRLKEHPSARTSLAARIDRLATESGGRLRRDNATDSFTQLRASRGVVTINSSMGLQAFFDDKPVVVLGRALYALPGLVEIADGPETLARKLAGAGALSFDPALRAAFMNWLDREYYPRTEPGPAGLPRLVAADARRALDRARGARRTAGGL